MIRGHLPVIELGERLNGWLDDEYVFFYSNSGSEANDVAFKIARQYHRQNGEGDRWKFVARYRGYHGNTMGSLAATGHAQRKYRYEPLAPGFLHVSPPDGYRCIYCNGGGMCGRECAVKYAAEIERVIGWELADTVAGVIMEPIITGGGVIVPPEGYVEEVAAVCERAGVPLIIDEVICGFGRTGKGFGHQHYGIRPDIVTMAKGQRRPGVHGRNVEGGLRRGWGRAFGQSARGLTGPADLWTDGRRKPRGGRTRGASAVRASAVRASV